jgi:hypothetical protein
MQILFVLAGAIRIAFSDPISYKQKLWLLIVRFS